MENETVGPAGSFSTDGVMTPEGMIEEANEKFAKAFMDFCDIITGPSQPSYICFVEGYDRDYYHCVVSHILTPDNAFVDCGGKRNVIKMHDRLSTKAGYAHLKTLYFVDRDYDDNSMLGNDFFITDHYSVENYYCSENVLSNVLQSYCHINIRKEKEQVERIMSDFKEWREKFLDVTKPFCAWYKTAHIRNIPKEKINYKKSFPSNLAKITKDGIELEEPPYDLTALNATYTPTPFVSQQEYDFNLATITSTDEVRGKFVLQFMEAYIMHLDKSTNGKDALIKKSFGFQSHRPTFMSNLSACADTTDRLRMYIISRR